MPRESNLELKVGAFVLIAFISLTFFLFSISDFSFFEKGDTMKVVFNFANGLRKSAPVRMAGVDTGSVKKIHLFFDREDRRTKVEVEIKVDKDTKIPVDSVFIINQLGLLGEKYMEIIPGVDTKHFFEAGDTIEGKDPVAQEMISEKIVDVANRLGGSIDSFNQIAGDAKNQESFKKALENVSLLTDRLNVLAGKVIGGEGTIGKFFTDESIYNNLDELTADLKVNPWKLLYVPKSEEQHKKKK